MVYTFSNHSFDMRLNEVGCDPADYSLGILLKQTRGTKKRTQANCYNKGMMSWQLQHAAQLKWMEANLCPTLCVCVACISGFPNDQRKLATTWSADDYGRSILGMDKSLLVTIHEIINTSCLRRRSSKAVQKNQFVAPQRSVPAHRKCVVARFTLSWR